MGGQTDKHRLNLSIDSELWRACSEISRQTGMNWSMVAAEAFALYVRYFAPRDFVEDVETGEQIQQLKPLSEAIQYFIDGGIFRATSPVYSREVPVSFGSEEFVLCEQLSSPSSTDIPVLQLADSMPYVETPDYIFELTHGDYGEFFAKFYRSCS